MTEDLDPGSASNGDDELEAMASAGDDVEHMLAQTGAGVTLNLDGRISRVGVSATTLFLSDRPYRLTGHIPTEEFVTQWGQGRQFRRGPPNALLSLFELGHRQRRRCDPLTRRAGICDQF